MVMIFYCFCKYSKLGILSSVGLVVFSFGHAFSFSSQFSSPSLLDPICLTIMIFAVSVKESIAMDPEQHS